MNTCHGDCNTVPLFLLGDNLISRHYAFAIIITIVPTDITVRIVTKIMPRIRRQKGIRFLRSLIIQTVVRIAKEIPTIVMLISGSSILR